MKKLPRLHHFLPVFYMMGFTRTGKRDGQLVVVDGKDERTWKGRPENVACEKDFYAIDSAGEKGVSPMAIEDAYAKLESTAAPVLSEILDTHRLPRDFSGMEVLLNLVASNHSRGIGSRRFMRRTMHELARKEMRELVSTRENFDELMLRMTADGIDVSKFSFEEAKAISDQNAMFYEVDQNWMIWRQIEGIDRILRILATRTWSLAIADVPGPEFICSDKPVHARPEFGGLPGNLRLDDPRARIVLPLSRRIALVGRTGGKRGARRADRNFIAEVNYGTAAFAYRYVFLPGEDFIWQNPAGGLGGLDDLKAFMESRPDSAVRSAHG